MDLLRIKSTALLCLATVALFASVGCATWQTPTVSFDFNDFISIDNDGVDLGIPVRVYIPFPGSGKVEPVATAGLQSSPAAEK